MVLMIIMWSGWQSIFFFVLFLAKQEWKFFTRENFLSREISIQYIISKEFVFFLFIFEIFWKILKFTFFSTVHSFIHIIRMSNSVSNSIFRLFIVMMILLLWSPYVYRKNWSTTTTIESNWNGEYGEYILQFQFDSSNGWFVCSTSNNNNIT